MSILLLYAVFYNIYIIFLLLTLINFDAQDVSKHVQCPNMDKSPEGQMRGNIQVDENCFLCCV